MRKINLIPMAGEGKRFLNEGYRTPKPLIKINGIPMFVHATKALPKEPVPPVINIVLFLYI